MRKLSYFILLVSLLASFNSFAQQTIELSEYISSNMVLQRGEPFPFRGKGPVGEVIEIDFVRNGVHYYDSVLADSSGNFIVELEPLEATSSPCTATLWIKGEPDSKVKLDNILIGDVWFAGGQSNMEKKVDYLLEADEVIADADNYTNIRSFRASYNHQFEPVENIKSSNDPWFICDSESVEKASAVAYIFAKEVYKSTGIPIGLMQAYVGGTELETWLSEDKIADDPDLQFVEDRITTLDNEDPKFYQKYFSVNYNGMVNPLKFFPIKGFLFYQGASNKKRATEYKAVFKALIEDWRTKWDLGEIPFYYVQLFNIGITDERNYEETPDQNTWQMVREQQLLLLEDESMENIGMAVTIETNQAHLHSDPNIRIHPRNKKPIGERLAKIALKEQYEKDIIAYSPYATDFWIEDNKLYVKFKNIGKGLKIRDGATTLQGFAIAGSDGQYFEADATIKGSDTVVLSSTSVQAPVHAAYGWSRDPICTLDNSANLPASPFRTVTEGLFDDKAIFYQDCEYEGSKKSFGLGDYSKDDLKAFGFSDNDISSIEIMDGYKVILYDEGSFSGPKLVLTADNACLKSMEFDNVTSSFKVVREQNSEITGMLGKSTNGNICIYPNPVDEYLGITNMSYPATSIIIKNITGQKIKNIEQILSEESSRINVENLKSGIYFLQWQQDRTKHTLKFIKI